MVDNLLSPDLFAAGRRMLYRYLNRRVSDGPLRAMQAVAEQRRARQVAGAAVAGTGVMGAFFLGVLVGLAGIDERPKVESASVKMSLTDERELDCEGDNTHDHERGRGH